MDEREYANLLEAWAAGDAGAADRLYAGAYDELKSIASRSLRGIGRGDQLQTTVLVNERYLKLAAAGAVGAHTRQHFLALCARAMRQIIVDSARRQLAGKRGGSDAHAVSISNLDLASGEASPALEAGPREFIVNTLVDDDDLLVGDGLCRRSAIDTSCTLRAAVMEANALPGADRIILPASASPYLLTIPQAAGPDDASGDLRIQGDGLSGSQTIRGVINAAGDRPTIAASMGDRLFSVVGANQPVIIEGLRLSVRQTPFSGGALPVVNGSAVTLRQLEIHGHSAPASGGAIDASGSTILIEDSDLHDNHTDGEGAAIRSHSSFLEIRRTSIRANTDGGAGAEQEAQHASGNGSTLVQNSTFSGNAGTALRIVDGDLEARNLTLAGNGRRGIEFARIDGRNLIVRNSALTDNGLGACSLTGAGNAGIATDGHNLTQGSGCDLHAGASNIVNASPVLGPLVASAAEFTAYHVPLAGSVLRDNGHPDVSALGCAASDQRGAIRPVDGDADGIARCDIGAIEAATAGSEVFRDGFE